MDSHRSSDAREQKMPNVRSGWLVRIPVSGSVCMSVPVIPDGASLLSGNSPEVSSAVEPVYVGRSNSDGGTRTSVVPVVLPVPDVPEAPFVPDVPEEPEVPVDPEEPVVPAGVGSKAQICEELQVSVLEQVPHDPPHPSEPHSLPEHAGVQDVSTGTQI